MRKLKIFLTGANGFIGKNILEQLSNKYAFYLPTHKDLDLLNYSQVESFFKNNRLFDVVIHTAIVGGNRKIPSTFDITVSNLKMFFNLARCKKYFKKMIHLGSGIEYGKEQPLVNIKEEDFDKRIPLDGFGYSKYICAKFIEVSDSILNLRLFGVYGKYEDYEIRFISNAICKSILGLPITINRNVFFDYLYVTDLVNIINYFINNDSQERVFNVGRGKPIDLLTIAHKINYISPKKSKIIITNKGMGNEYTCNNKRLISEIGKYRFTDFDHSLEELYSWYLSIKPKLKREAFLNDYF